MALLKQKSPRRREIRRNAPAATRTWQRVWHDRRLTWAVVFVVIFTILGGILAHVGRQRPRFVVGQVVTEPIVPRVRFESVDAMQTQNDKKDAYGREKARYVPNTEYLDKMQANLIGLVGIGEHIPNATFGEIEEIIARENGGDLEGEHLMELSRIASDPARIETWRESVKEFRTALSSRAVLSDVDADRETREEDRAPGVLIWLDEYDSFFPRSDNVIRSVADDKDYIRELLRQEARRAGFPVVLIDRVVESVMTDIQPFFTLDAKATELARARARDSVEPTEMAYTQLDVLVPAGGELTSDDMILLRDEEAAYQARMTTTARSLRWVGMVGMIGVLGTAIWIYILAYNDRLAKNPMRGAALLSLMLGCQAAAIFGMYQFPNWAFGTAVLPTLFVAIVLAVAYDQRFALAIGVMHTLLLAISLDLPIQVSVTALVGVAVAVGQLREVRTRSKIVIVGILTGAAMAGATLLMGFASREFEFDQYLNAQTIRDIALTNILHDTKVAMWTGVITGMFVQGVLPGIERLFKVTTAMKLKDLNDASLPLLRRLAQEAPGTFQHSLNMANMSEAAADSIGANGLLCKVGAMYHDIGKINKPGYFIENQGGGPNRHDKLSPAMSLLIIVGHVKDGMEMAREYGLPPVLRHFIESHHGTTLVEYFYHAAKQQRDAENEPAPQDFEFRYPGPKPQTKEAAILMLCDGVEGAARTLPEPTPVRLEQLVHRMAQKRLTDGQFDECNVTLKELHRIEQAVTRTLCAIYHGRIKYPTDNHDFDDAKSPATPAVGATAAS